MECFNNKVSVTYAKVHVLRHLKGKLAWAIGRWLQVVCYLKQLYH